MTFEKVIKHFTTRGLRVEDIQRYLDAGGDINRRDPKMNWSLLHYAAEDCNPKVIQFLVAHGAELNAINRNGWTPLHLAVDTDLDTSRSGGQPPAQLATTQTLIELGADETIRAQDGKVPRDIAAAYRQETLYDSLPRPRSA